MSRSQRSVVGWVLAGVSFSMAGLLSQPIDPLALLGGGLFFVVAAGTTLKSQAPPPPPVD